MHSARINKEWCYKINSANRTCEAIWPEGITVYCDSSGQADEWLAQTPCHAASWSIADVCHG